MGTACPSTWLLCPPVPVFLLPYFFLPLPLSSSSFLIPSLFVILQPLSEKKVSVSHSVVSEFATPWTKAHQTPPSMGFSRQESWSGLTFPSPGDLPNPGIEPGSSVLQADSLPPEPPGRILILSPENQLSLGSGKKEPTGKTKQKTKWYR